MGEAVKLIAKNRRAFYDYSIEDRWEAGIVLEGTEIKSVKEGRISFSDAWAEIVSGEIWLNQMSISENPFSSLFNHEPLRKKKLLLHKSEIKRLTRKVDLKGFTLVPLSFYLKRGRVKVELGLCKGKKSFDKRAGIRERDIERETAREFRNRYS
ncbi:MAG: SsrA-binding protein SmpB [Spirochaetaceae bacterium]|jgi:SsrA-binding protein|nr:SsrA-binding protein SmpB [Spirochaetaceae bacterium]